MKKMKQPPNVKITCLSLDCPERKSLCCGAFSSNASLKMGKINDSGEFVCSNCGKPFVGGKCIMAMMDWEELCLFASIYNEIEDYSEDREATHWKINLQKLKDFALKQRQIIKYDFLRIANEGKYEDLRREVEAYFKNDPS